MYQSAIFSNYNTWMGYHGSFFILCFFFFFGLLIFPCLNVFYCHHFFQHCFVFPTVILISFPLFTSPPSFTSLLSLLCFLRMGVTAARLGDWGTGPELREELIIFVMSEEMAGRQFLTRWGGMGSRAQVRLFISAMMVDRSLGDT